MMKVTVIMTMLLMLTMTTARVSGRRMKKVEGQPMTSVSVGQGGVWAVDENNNIYYRNNTYGTDGDKGSDWITVPGGLKQLDVGNNVVWGVNRHDQIYIRTGINADNPQGTNWRNIAGRLKHVSVSPAGHVWGVNTHDWIYIRVGASNTNAGTVWKRIGGGLKQVSVGKSGVWGVNSANQVFYCDNTYGDYDPEGTTWIQVSDMPMTYVSSESGAVFGISDGKLYTRKGMSDDTPTGTEWKQIMKKDEDLQVVDSFNGYIWAIKNGQHVWRGFQKVKL